MTPPTAKRPERAFRPGLTLIEAVATVVIIAIAAPAVMWAMARGHDLRIGPVMVNRARFLAAERLEEVLADRFNTARGYTYVQTSNYTAENAVTGFAGLSRTTSVSETGASLSGSGTGYKTVTVTVGWFDRRGARSLKLSTVVTDY